ncbi:hypothetical protein BT63DRAFT_309232 [Microthyrium microscopicum]|uniref:Uncharacterized protein n=1 Tax=Microthyrium microscopicum TaxID=703497 RepID=A0A6A6U763_9PEZI|nr:hypothetical protein BT63DRAFT_309232 [Microthyrium microscopicum]
MLRPGANFRENNDNEIKLPDCDSEAFSSYVAFLYTGKIFSQFTKSEDELAREEGMLFSLLKLADFLQDDLLHNCVIDTFVAQVKQNYFTCKLITRACEAFPIHSPFVRLLQALCVQNKLDMPFDDVRSAHDTSEFWFLVAQGKEKEWETGRARRRVDAFEVEDVCAYHIHEDGKRC